MINKYDATAESQHKKEIRLELNSNLSAQTRENELLQSLKNQISSLKRETTFIQGNQRKRIM